MGKMSTYYDEKAAYEQRYRSRSRTSRHTSSSSYSSTSSDSSSSSYDDKKCYCEARQCQHIFYNTTEIKSSSRGSSDKDGKRRVRFLV